MKQFRHFLGAMFVLTVAAPTFGAWTFNPATGHWYQVVSVGTAIDWNSAQSSAVAAGGYLATITTDPENTFVYNLAFANVAAWGSVALLEYGPWLGGYQLPGSSEPDGGWQWIPADPFGYTNWNTATEPNDLDEVEDKLHFHARWAPAGTWNDLRTSGEDRIFGYVVEREIDPAVPAASSWGVVVMALLTLGAGTVVLREKRAGGDYPAASRDVELGVAGRI